MKIEMKKLVIAVVACTAILSGCQRSQNKGGMEIVHRTITVGKSDQTLLSDYSAKLKGSQFVEIRPQVSGVITKICFNEGDQVRKGQVLFIIDQVPYEAALKTAEANVKSVEAKIATAELNLESKRQLFNEDVISEYDLRTAENQVLELKAQLSQAQAQELNARNNLSYTEVKSPVNGVTSMIPYRVGALVSSNIAEPLVTVSDISTIYAYFSMSENQILDIMERYGSLEEGKSRMDQVSLRMSNGKLYPLKGKIDAISGNVEESTGAISLRASFPNPDGLLRNGARGNIEFSTVRENCMVIPQSATYELQNRLFAYKVINGIAVAAPIEVFRLNNGTDYIVESGLEEGDVIIAEGAGLVRAGAAIKTTSEKD